MYKFMMMMMMMMIMTMMMMTMMMTMMIVISINLAIRKKAAHCLTSLNKLNKIGNGRITSHSDAFP
jgi:hypothetical protein